MLGFLSPEGHPGEVRWPVFSEEAMGGASWTLNLVGLAWHPHWDLLGWCGQWREDTDFVPTVGPGMPVGHVKCFALNGISSMLLVVTLDADLHHSSCFPPGMSKCVQLVDS